MVWYRDVPKDPVKNLEFRRELIRNADGNQDLIDELWLACRRDRLFWINAFLWIFEPRTGAILPFVTWPYEDEAIQKIAEAIGHHDLVIEKSRDMGASWMCITSLVHEYQFEDMQMFLLMSRKEALVDKTGDPKSMFWKFDFLMDHQPSWLRPKTKRGKLHAENTENGSTMDGDTTTEFAGTGDRRRALVLDEFSKMPNNDQILAATRDVTNCRLFNFTPWGAGNASYKIAMNPRFNKLILHWTKHPDKAKGCYTCWSKDGPEKSTSLAAMSSGKKVPLDPEKAFDVWLAHRGKTVVRSPWFDEQCDRAGSRQEIAQELEIDYLASGSQFFDPQVLEQVRERDVMPAIHTGDIQFNRILLDDIKFTDDPRGFLRLWVRLQDGKPPMDRDYVAGADISSGTGASNSVISVADCVTREKVAEYTNAFITPEELGRIGAAIGKWFGGRNGEAYFAWEANGPGRVFGKSLRECGYGNVYLKRDELGTRQRVTDKPGWFSGKDEKVDLLAELRRALKAKDFICHSQESVKEYGEYVYLPEGGVGHISENNEQDPSGAKAQHGDRVIADALCNKLLQERASSRVGTKSEPERGSLAQRMHDRKMRRLEAEFA